MHRLFAGVHECSGVLFSLKDSRSGGDLQRAFLQCVIFPVGKPGRCADRSGHLPFSHGQEELSCTMQLLCTALFWFSTYEYDFFSCIISIPRVQWIQRWIDSA